MANAKVEALRWLLSKPLVPIARKVMGKPVTLSLPNESIINTGNDMTNILENLAYNSLINKPGFFAKEILPHEGLIRNVRTSSDFPVGVLTGKSNKRTNVYNPRKARYKSLPRTPEDAAKMTEDAARRADNNMFNVLYDISNPANSEFMKILNSLNYTYTPDYAQAAYRAVPYVYGGIGATGLGGYQLGRNQ